MDKLSSLILLFSVGPFTLYFLRRLSLVYLMFGA